MPQIAIAYSHIRGGSSKGLYFKAEDLPHSEELRNEFLLAAMGKGERQIDGLGGADPLTSKVAIVSPSSRPGIDIDFLFAQVIVGKNSVDTKPNCGNILAGVGPFAIETGMIKPIADETRIVVYMLNSGKECELILQTPKGKLTYSGTTKIDGVPGTSAPIICNYRDLAGSACGSLLPTGSSKDIVDGVEVTCIDNGMPVVIMTAESMGITGRETPQELNANQALCERLYKLRMTLGKKMNLGDVSQMAVPKMCMVSKATRGGTISTRTFIPSKCHAAIGVLGAVSVASACMLANSVCHPLASVAPSNNNPLRDFVDLSIEHPSGEFTVKLETSKAGKGIVINKAGVIRTARLLSRGELFVPSRLVIPYGQTGKVERND